ncbi:HupE/UreJ family protein [uncultured Thiothrix sp.]|uniref:HupE/UreJ family protein n=1 Tax=uncultured Thiothrix sp. TaxID=223185 RepID=UPI00262DD83D|nr:HupE/UreJ family protein [uncultured Thiothrix sp.]HMT93215.1 HupE/UreJ family protein [Thiolinea sp.]
MSHFFWQGCLHPLLVPAHLLVLLALGLLLGQQTPSTIRTSLVVYVAGLGSALFLTRVLPRMEQSELSLLILALSLGLLVILKLRINLALIVTLSISASLLIGLDSRVSALPGLDASKIYLQLLGIAFSASLLLSLLALISFYLNKLLAGIAVRIIGAWVTAGSLMVLALLLHELIS